LRAYSKNRAGRGVFLGAVAQLVKRQPHSQNRVPGTRLPEHDHPPCLLATEIRADVREPPSRITCGQPQTVLGPKFKIVDYRPGSPSAASD
jgi:hypothetical protein